jgi:hypothetical protein
MRFAGTCTMYLKNAIPQLMAAAMYHGFNDKFLRWAYEAQTHEQVGDRKQGDGKRDGSQGILLIGRYSGWVDGSLCLSSVMTGCLAVLASL